nr:hypothetical protein [Nocardia nova]
MPGVKKGERTSNCTVHRLFGALGAREYVTALNDRDQGVCQIARDEGLGKFVGGDGLYDYTPPTFDDDVERAGNERYEFGIFDDVWVLCHAADPAATSGFPRSGQVAHHSLEGRSFAIEQLGFCCDLSCYGLQCVYGQIALSGEVVIHAALADVGSG